MAEEQYQYLAAQNRAMSLATKQTIERLKAMPWDERAETVAQLGLDLLVFHGAGKFTCTALAKFITLSTELKAIAQAERVAAAAGKASAPITELGQQVAVVGKVAATEGPEAAKEVVEIITENPALLAEGKPIAQVVQEVVKDVKIGRGSNFVNQTKEQLLKSKASHEALVREHVEKLAAYASDPDRYDHLGFLKNVSQEIRQKRIQGRIRELERQIQRQRGDLDIIDSLLKSKE